MNKDTLFSEIDALAAEHQTIDDDDAYEYESLESRATLLIIRFLSEKEISITGYDLSKYIDEAYPESTELIYDHHEELMDLFRKADNPVSDIPDEAKELISYYEKAFWPEFYSD